MAKNPTNSQQSKSTPSTPASPAKKSAAKPAQAGGSSVIDTNLAANAAAAMVRRKVIAPSASVGPQKETGAFKQLKAGLNNPTSSTLGGQFAVAAQKKKSNAPLHGGKQVGHNQTFTSEATRAGVPRRTAG